MTCTRSNTDQKNTCTHLRVTIIPTEPRRSLPRICAENTLHICTNSHLMGQSCLSQSWSIICGILCQMLRTIVWFDHHIHFTPCPESVSDFPPKFVLRVCGPIAALDTPHLTGTKKQYKLASHNVCIGHNLPKGCVWIACSANLNTKSCGRTIKLRHASHRTFTRYNMNQGRHACTLLHSITIFLDVVPLRRDSLR